MTAPRSERNWNLTAPAMAVESRLGTRMRFLFWFVPILLLAADPAWQTKQIADWNEDEAHEVLTDSLGPKP